MIGFMTHAVLPREFKGFSVYLVGIKGTGMAALAELLRSLGAEVMGSDVPEEFYTDAILKRLGISYYEEFSPNRPDSDCNMLIHSAAYNAETNPEIRRALESGIPVLTYPEALGLLSEHYESAGSAGGHGKTTTTALTGTLVKALKLPAVVLAGGAVSNFGDSSVMIEGQRFFIAETCEYQRHFLSFSPKHIVLTSVEPDHLDYFSGYEDIQRAFIEYGLRCARQGALIYCADEPGARETAGRIKAERPDLRLIPYGFAAAGKYRILESRREEGISLFTLAGFKESFEIRVPGKHTILNASGALALAALLYEEEKGTVPDAAAEESMAEALKGFSGSRRRSEILGEAGGVLFMDDYAHHPTAISTTLEGLKDFYPRRRVIADFMSHTYSRTKALLSEFAGSFGAAEEVILHKIYPSAREKAPLIEGRSLFQETLLRHRKVLYFEEIEEALPYLQESLRPGDLFITLGAGNNWVLSRELYRQFKNREDGQQ